MKRRILVKKLLKLSEEQLNLTLAEEWTRWEDNFRRKKEVYVELLTLKKGLPDREESKLLLLIRDLEARTKKELAKKQDKIRRELQKISRLRAALKNYHQLKGKTPTPHFSLRG